MGRRRACATTDWDGSDCLGIPAKVAQPVIQQTSRERERHCFCFLEGFAAAAAATIKAVYFRVSHGWKICHCLRCYLTFFYAS